MYALLPTSFFMGQQMMRIGNASIIHNQSDQRAVAPGHLCLSQCDGFVFGGTFLETKPYGLRIGGLHTPCGLEQPLNRFIKSSHPNSCATPAGKAPGYAEVLGAFPAVAGASAAAGADAAALDTLLEAFPPQLAGPVPHGAGSFRMPPDMKPACAARKAAEPVPCPAVFRQPPGPRFPGFP